MFVLCFVMHCFVSFLVLMGKRKLVALLCLTSECLVTALWLFLTLSWVNLQSVFVVFRDHTLAFLICLR